MLVNWSANAFSDHKCTGVLASVDGLNSLVQVTDDCLAGGGWRYLDLVHFAIGHFDDTMGEIFESDIVCHHDHGDLLPHVEVDEDLHDNVCAACIQITCWLIEEQNLGLVRDGASNSHSLLLTTGQLVREVIHSLFEADVLQELAGSVADLLSGKFSLELHRKLNVFERGERTNQVKGLENEAELVETN